jgi:hypothetical protein
MLTKKAYHRKPRNSSHSQTVPRMEEARGTGSRRTTRLEAIIVDTNVLASMKRPQAEAIKWFAKLVLEAREDSEDKRPRRRLVVKMDPKRRIPMFEIEDAGTEPAESNDLDAALAEARERGVSRAVEILSRGEMLSAADFAKFIGVSREAVRAKHQRNEVLGLKGAKRGLRFPKWQVTSNGGLLPDLPRIFDLLGGDSWTVYRFLTQHHPELEGDTALSALLRGKIEKVFTAAENTAGAFS